jgi:hypothetical protein
MSNNINHRLIYQSLLAEMDSEARDEFPVDPRIAQYALRNPNDEQDLGTYARPTFHAGIGDEVSNVIAVDPETEIDSLAVPVQNQPNMVDQKQVIIIDTAQRDWVKQPDAYSNVFSFGQQTPISVAGIQVPFYYNNQVVPYSAFEMPRPTLGGAAPNQYANNRPRIIPGTSVPVPVPGSPIPGLATGQTYGWRLVTDKTTGAIKHYNDPGMTDPPNAALYNTVYFPPYDPTSGRGGLIGIDSNIRNVDIVGNTFGTQLELSNVKSLRLVRATLPIRKFDTFNPSIFTDVSGSGNSNTFNQFTANMLNTFHTEPYILMSIENMKGQYYGAGQVVQNAFAALVQTTRTTYDANQAIYLGQFQDYYPWSDEAYEFDPPLAQLSNANISLSNSYGEEFNHLDNASVLQITVGTDTGFPATLPLGVLRFTLYMGGTVPSTVPGGDSNIYFSVNDFRSGDEIVFYQPVIDQLIADPNTTPALQTFLNLLQTHSVIVTQVASQTNLISAPTLLLGYQFDAVIQPTSVADAFAINSALAAVAAEMGVQQTVVFNNYDVAPSTFSVNYPLPIMNRMMQAAYAFEAVTLVPDSGQLGKIIPN